MVPSLKRSTLVVHQLVIPRYDWSISTFI